MVIVVLLDIVVNFKGFAGWVGVVVLREHGGELGDAVNELGEGGDALVEGGFVDGFFDAVGEGVDDGEQFVVQGLKGCGGFGREGTPLP